MSNIKKLMMSSAAGGSSSFAYFGMDFTYAYNDIIWGEGIARDSEGNYIVVGRVWTSTRYGYIVKLDPNGNTLASYLVDASSKYGEVLDVCVDSSDNIYILLRMQGNNSQVPTIAKLNSSFTLQWIKSYDNSGWGMDSYRGNWGAITTDGTDVYATCALSVSGVGAGGMYLRASCSNGTASALKHFRNSGTVQQYQCNICIDSNNDYVVITGHNETWGDGVAVIVDLSTNAIKSNGVYRLDSSFGYDGFTANADPDDSGNVFIAGHWYDTGTSTRWLSVAKLDPSAATPLQSQYNWAPFTGSSSGALRVRPMATNNSNGDVILWALSGYNNTGGGGSSNTRTLTALSLTSNLQTLNYAERYEIHGSYDEGIQSQYNVQENNGMRGVLSADGSQYVMVNAHSNFYYAASTQADTITVTSLPTSGAYGAGSYTGFNVVSLNNTSSSSTTMWQGDSLNQYDLLSTMTEVNNSSNWSTSSISLTEDLVAM